MNTPAPSPNQEAIDVWNGALFDKFVRFRHILAAGLEDHGESALARRPPAPGDHVLDIGCGFGDTTQAIARRVGPDGRAVGIDVAARFIDLARREAAQARIDNASYEVRDAEQDELGGPYQFAFARFGTMFFANPVAALANIRASLLPGAWLCMVVWRRREDSPLHYLAQQVVEEILPISDGGEGVTGGPGPFSMASPDLVSAQLLAAGWRDACFERHDAPIMIGRDLDDAVQFALALGPAGERIRLAGETGEAAKPRIMAALRTAFAPHLREDGVWLTSSAWIVSARNP